MIYFYLVWIGSERMSIERCFCDCWCVEFVRTWQRRLIVSVSILCCMLKHFSHSDTLSRFLWFLLVPRAVVLCRTSGPGMRNIHCEWILKLFCFPDQPEKTERGQKKEEIRRRMECKGVWSSRLGLWPCKKGHGNAKWWSVQLSSAVAWTDWLTSWVPDWLVGWLVY